MNSNDKASLAYSIRKLIEKNNYVHTLMRSTYYFVRRTYFGSQNYDLSFYFPKSKIGFIAVPKAGNSTIKKILMDREGLKVQNEMHYSNLHKESDRFKTRKENLENLQKVRTEILVFSFVRNPFTRLVSGWQNKIIKERPNEIDKTYFGIIKNRMPFERFARNICLIPDRYQNQHFISQHRFLYERGNLVPKYIGKLENFEDDIWKILNSRMEGREFKYNKVNRSEYKRSWQDYYSQESARKVYKRYKKDFELFGYEEEYPNLLQYIKNKEELLHFD